MASKLLLLPLIPALAFGMVEVAKRISIPTVTEAPTARAPKAEPDVVVIEHQPPPVTVVKPDVPPPVAPDPCIDCTATA